MTIERRNFPQFFITAPAPCPYLPGRIERKVFTHLIGADARQLNSQLSQSGFRRSQNIAYRPACDGCSSCVSVRVCVSEFEWTPAFRKIVRRNNDIATHIVQAKATSEQYSLFRSYIDDRHADGGMADMTVLDFAAMVDETFVDSKLVEYRVASGERLGLMNDCVVSGGKSRAVTNGRSGCPGLCSQISGSPLRSVTYTSADSLEAQLGICSLRWVVIRGVTAAVIRSTETTS